jgi:SAM-dependent methyltransferase
VEQIFDLRAVRQHRDRAAAPHQNPRAAAPHINHAAAAPHINHPAAAPHSNQNAAAARLENIAPVLAELADRLLDRLDDTTRQFTRALDFGGRGAIAPSLIQRGMQVVSADLSAPMAALAGGTPLWIESENFGLGEQQFDLVVAHLSLHWINDLPGALIQLRRALKPDGLLLASMPVLGTLAGLRSALLEAEEACTGGVSPRVSPFPDLRDCAGLLQRAGFSLPVADIEEIEFLYANPLALLHELRDAGETNAVHARSRKFAPRTLFPAALSALPMRDGRYVAPLRMAIMTGWAP